MRTSHRVRNLLNPLNLLSNKFFEEIEVELISHFFLYIPYEVHITV